MHELRAITLGNRRQSHEVRDLCADQAGVVRRAQLIERGLSPAAIDRALRAGALHRLHRGVYSVVPPELLAEDASLVAALMATGRGSFLSQARQRGAGGSYWRRPPRSNSACRIAEQQGTGSPSTGSTSHGPVT
jgi:hypothetical protein